MRKFFIILLLFLGCNIIFANENIHNSINDGDSIIYLPYEQKWATGSADEDGIVFKKILVEGTGSHSIYKNQDDSLAFALATDYEMINNGNLIVVDNNLLKYYKLVYNNEAFEQIELTEDEIRVIFPNAEILKISQIDNDNKMWLHKPFSKKRVLLLVNDTDKFFHRITCKSKNIQDSEIKGLITISRYGIVRFSHFGERNGKLIFYIR